MHDVIGDKIAKMVEAEEISDTEEIFKPNKVGAFENVYVWGHLNTMQDNEENYLIADAWNYEFATTTTNVLCTAI